ncbi:MAG: CheR family methyltransferase [Myxococcaceae bacterium]
MLNIAQTALEQLATLLLERAGLKIAADGFHGLKLALKERMPALGIDDAEEYVRRLRERAGEHELRSLLPLVTVTHTEFFRDQRQFRALEKNLLPEALARARRDGRKVRIWSAGCATGEEPYSLAMVLADMGAKPEEVDLWATDLNQAAVESARVGRYSLRRVGAVSPERVSRYFTPTEDGYQVRPLLRDYVRFEGLNLAAPVFGKLGDRSFDVILCRNVIIYFDLPTIRGLMDRFHAALLPGAFLVLGYSESLFRVYDRFEMVEVDGAFLYRRPKPETTPATPTPLAHEQPRITGKYPVIVPADRPRAGAQPDANVPPSLPPPSLKVPPPAPTPPVRKYPTGEYPIVVPASHAEGVVARAPAAEQTARPTRRPSEEVIREAARLINLGAFEPAVKLLLKLREDEPGDLAAQLTLGNVYSLIGRSADADAVFAETSTREPLCVEVRVYGAVAAMQVGDFERARSELGKALFLEPTLALAHYLAAQVAERLGDHVSARRSYRNAIAQLRFPQRPLAGYYPELLEGPELISRASKYALAALEEAS